jgi:hypothetical protein
VGWWVERAGSRGAGPVGWWLNGRGRCGLRRHRVHRGRRRGRRTLGAGAWRGRRAGLARVDRAGRGGCARPGHGRGRRGGGGRGQNGHDHPDHDRPGDPEARGGPPSPRRHVDASAPQHMPPASLRLRFWSCQTQLSLQMPPFVVSARTRLRMALPIHADLPENHSRRRRPPVLVVQGGELAGGVACLWAPVAEGGLDA